VGLFLDGNRYIVTCWFEAFNYNYSFVVYPNDVVKPETKYWNTIKKNMPDIFWTRIENWAVPGVPDCYGCKDGVMFWVELKITKDKKVKLSPFQKAWHFNHSKQGGRSFIMLHSLAESLSCIFPSSIAVSHPALTSSIASYTHVVPGDPSSWQRAQRELLHCPLPPSPQKPYIPSK
jgi:hypothetical protein